MGRDGGNNGEKRREIILMRHGGNSEKEWGEIMRRKGGNSDDRKRR